MSAAAGAWTFPERLFGAWVENMDALPERLSDMIGEAAALLAQFRQEHDALRPFADGVFNDNGDLTIRTSFEADDVQRAYFVHRRTAAAISGGETA